MIGKQLGHYKIVSQLGRGGMASVFMAEQLGLERRVALKILQPSLAADDVIVQRFQQEARIAANLHHAHVVTIYDVGEIEGIYYIAMRYIEGENFGQLLRREGPLEPTRALAMLEQVAEALDFAHSRNVLHRDIKPANVMVEPGDVMTLTDFGIARAGEASHLTATRMVIGTPEYMSPEQARGDAVDKRSDLYALGVLTYEALGGRPPFSAASTPSLLYLHVHEPPPPLAQLRPDLPYALSDVLVRALAKNPEDRFQSSREMVAAARAALTAPRTMPDGPATTGLTGATIVDPSIGRGGRGPSPLPPTPIPLPPTPAAGGRIAPPPPPGGGARMEPAARASTRTLTPPPVPQSVERITRGTGMLPPDGGAGNAGARKRSSTWLLGPAIVAVALIAVGALILLQSGLIGGATATPTPTVVAAKPTAPPSTAQAATGPTAAAKPAEAAKPETKPSEASKPVAGGPTAAPKPDTAATPVPKPTDAPTAAPKPTTPPTPVPTATPDPMQRVVAAQAAVSSGDFPTAISELDAMRQDPTIKNDPNLGPMVNETLKQTRVVYGNQLLDQGKLDDSYNQFTEALKLVPNDPDALDGQKRVVLTKNYGIMEANWGKDDDAAIGALEQNMQLNPDFRDTRQKLYSLLIAKADRLLGAGDRNGAFPVLTRALEVVPDGAEAKTRLVSYTPTPVPQPTPVPYVPPAAPPRTQPQAPAPAPRPAPAPAPAPAPQPERPFVPPGTPV